MRKAVARAYEELTGCRPLFIFSGWGGELSEARRAFLENRPPARPMSAPTRAQASETTMPGMSIERTDDGRWWYLRVGAFCSTDDVSLYQLRERLTAALTGGSAAGTPLTGDEREAVRILGEYLAELPPGFPNGVEAIDVKERLTLGLLRAVHRVATSRLVPAPASLSGAGEVSDDVWQLDQAIEDAIALPRPAGQIARLRAIRDRLAASGARVPDGARDGVIEQCANVCELEALGDDVSAEPDRAYNLAIRHAAHAIRAMKSTPTPGASGREEGITLSRAEYEKLLDGCDPMRAFERKLDAESPATDAAHQSGRDTPTGTGR